MDCDSNDLFRDDDEEQDNDYIQDQEASKEFVVYMIDAGLDMFLQIQEEEDGTSKRLLDVVVKSIVESLKTRIINRDYDEVAICFFNTALALSTTEAESRAFVEASKEALWIKYLLNEIDL